MKLKQYDRIEITWVDSIHQSGWRKLNLWLEEEKKDGHGLRHVTLGYLILEDKEVITVCQSMNIESAFSKNIDAIMSIPAVAVVKMRKLK